MAGVHRLQKAEFCHKERPLSFAFHRIDGGETS